MGAVKAIDTNIPGIRGFELFIAANIAAEHCAWSNAPPGNPAISCVAAITVVAVT